MRVLVDTCIWSLALRRKRSLTSPEVEALAQLIREDRAHLIGAVRQELLSGIPSPGEFERVVAHLQGFSDLPLDPGDYIRAASFHNICRGRGIQGSNTDFLLCAAAERHELAIFTNDKDFTRFAKYLPIHLYREVRE